MSDCRSHRLQKHRCLIVAHFFDATQLPQQVVYLFYTRDTHQSTHKITFCVCVHFSLGWQHVHCHLSKAPDFFTLPQRCFIKNKKVSLSVIINWESNQKDLFKKNGEVAHVADTMVPSLVCYPPRGLWLSAGPQLLARSVVKFCLNHIPQ